MKLRKFISRRRLKWAGTLAAVSVALIWIGSVFISYNHYRLTKRSETVMGLLEGRLYAAFYPRYPKGGLWLEDAITQGFEVNADVRVRLWFTKEPIAGGPDWWVAVPLWPLLLLIVVPTTLLWHSDRRPKPWQCGKCRYDLSGLEGEGDGSGAGAVCPECGLAIGEGEA